MSLSRPRNFSISARVLIAPQPTLLMKSTGEVVFGTEGNLRSRTMFALRGSNHSLLYNLSKKSSSAGLISLFVRRIWNVICAVKISLSHSNKPLAVYWNTMNVIESVRF